jgi:hypothetical protein
MKERVRTIAAVIALVASMPTLTIAVGNWSGNLSDSWAIYALILMSFFGLPASGYLVASYWRERKARDTEQASSGLIARSETELAGLSAHRGRTPGLIARSEAELASLSAHRGRTPGLIARSEAELAAQNRLYIERGRHAP